MTRPPGRFADLKRRALGFRRNSARAGPAGVAAGDRPAGAESDDVSVALVAALIFLLCAQGFGPMIVICELALLAVLIARSRSRLPSLGAFTAVLLAFPLFAVLSTLWSVVPPATLRYSIQLLLTTLAGLVIARSLPLGRFALAVFLGITVASVVGLVLGRTGPSPTGPVLIALAGSKNQMGYAVLVGYLASLAVVADRERTLAVRALALASIPMSLFMLAQGQVATALISAIVGTAVFVLLCLGGWLGRSKRFVLLVTGLAAAASLSAMAPQFIEWSERVASDVFQKDMTLSGRTLLWEAADELIAERPVGGHGYRGIWMGPEGRALLARNRQSDARGFNFHDTIREVRADLGLLGLALFVLPLAFCFVRLLVAFVDRATMARAFCLTLLLTVLLRLRTELVLNPFLLDTVLLYAIMGYSAAIVMGVGARGRSRPFPVRARRDPAAGERRRAMPIQEVRRSTNPEQP